MANIRKRAGKKGTTYQVRYPDPSSNTGYSYKAFDTAKEARAFREDAPARATMAEKGGGIVTVSDAVTRWLEICEKEGLDGREPVTKYTLDNYTYRAEF